MTSKTKCVIALGSNVGDRLKTLLEAGAEIQSAAADGEIKWSSIYETEAVLPEGAPIEWNQPYLNAAIVFESKLSAVELLALTRRLETKFGRAEDRRRWSPRELDIDILFYQGADIQTSDLTLPHPRVWEREFVLAPLRDLAPISEFEIDVDRVDSFRYAVAT